MAAGRDTKAFFRETVQPAFSHSLDQFQNRRRLICARVRHLILVGDHLLTGPPASVWVTLRSVDGQSYRSLKTLGSKVVAKILRAR